MWRRSVLLLATLPMDPSKLFGSGRTRTAQQKKIYQELKDANIQETFPHIAACWVGPCWGTVMQTPSNVSPVCVKMAVWRCSQCLEEFELSIAKFIDDGGVCPLCNKAQKKLPPTTVRNVKGELVTKDPRYTKAPRMVHSNYRSVLFSNPEWEHKNIQPMLAQRWELVADQLLDTSKDGHKDLLLASPKIDGVRCIVGFNSRFQKVQFFSRGGILLECCDGLIPELMPLFQKDPSLMLDGELFAPECNFEQLNSLVRRLSKHADLSVKGAQNNLLEYFAFDIMYSSQLAPDAPFEERYRLLKKIIPVCGAKRISNYQHDEKKKKLIRATKQDIGPPRTTDGKVVKVYHVPAAQVHPEEMKDVLSEACSQGFEGVMIRRPEFPYEHGRRSFGLLKYKQMHDAEFRVVGFLAGEGKFNGGLGAFVCETKDGLRFHAPPKVSVKRRLELWGQRRQYLGKYMTVQYQELSSQEVPRFPIAKAVRGGDNKADWL